MRFPECHTDTQAESECAELGDGYTRRSVFTTQINIKNDNRHKTPTVDGGSTWSLRTAPVFTLQREPLHIFHPLLLELS